MQAQPQPQLQFVGFDMNTGHGLFQETLKSLLKETLGDHFYIKRRPKGDFLDLKRRPNFRLL